MTGTTQRTKQRIVYAALLVFGGVFVLSLFLPVSESTARFVATLSFGIMSGMWICHLVYST